MNKTVTTQSRFKSWAMWSGIAGAVWLIFSAIGVPEKIGLTNESFNTILNAIGTILTLLGIVNNPTDSKRI